MAAGAQKQSSSTWLIIFLLILLIVGVFLLLPSYNTGVNTATQNASENQCPRLDKALMHNRKHSHWHKVLSSTGAYIPSAAIMDWVRILFATTIVE